MIKIIAVVALLASSCAASAAMTPCKQMEYAQIKDMAATPEGRRALRVEHCSMDAAPGVVRYNGGGQANANGAAGCWATMDKIKTALQAAGDTDSFDYSDNRPCPKP